jgi:hypothetical protein
MLPFGRQIGRRRPAAAIYRPPSFLRPVLETVRDLTLQGQEHFVHKMDVNKSKHLKTAGSGRRGRDPPRPRGRPPLPAGEAKRTPLTIHTSQQVKDDLLKASKAAGRSLTAEIEFHIERSLGLDRDKDDMEVWIDRVLADLKPWFAKFMIETLESSDPSKILKDRLVAASRTLDDLPPPTEVRLEPKPKPKPKPRRP